MRIYIEYALTFDTTIHHHKLFRFRGHLQGFRMGLAYLDGEQGSSILTYLNLGRALFA